VITQNIDGLHQASGIPDDRVVELHGNTTYAHCLDCKTRYELDALHIAFERSGTPPLCNDCGGFVKTATISFGQAMPPEAMRRAEIETRAADLFWSPDLHWWFIPPPPSRKWQNTTAPSW